MDLHKLAEKKAEITDRWVELTLGMYVPSFFTGRKDRMNNPIGYTVAEGVKELYTILSEGAELDGAREHLEKIIKIQAVQDCSPSKAVSFIFQSKQLVRDALVKCDSGHEVKWLSDFESRVDAVSLMAFDIYMECREQLHRVRVRELETGTHTLTSGVCRPGMAKRNPNKLAENTHCSK